LPVRYWPNIAIAERLSRARCRAQALLPSHAKINDGLASTTTKSIATDRGRRHCKFAGTLLRFWPLVVQTLIGGVEPMRHRHH